MCTCLYMYVMYILLYLLYICTVSCVHVFVSSVCLHNSLSVFPTSFYPPLQLKFEEEVKQLRTALDVERSKGSQLERSVALSKVHVSVHA